MRLYGLVDKAFQNWQAPFLIMYSTSDMGCVTDLENSLALLERPNSMRPLKRSQN